MSLSVDQIKALLAKPQKRRGSKKTSIDPSVRDVATWFKLAPKAMDENAQALPHCDNPNCLDDRPGVISATGLVIKSQFTIELRGQRICRRCFLGGWLLDNPDQDQLAV